MPTKTKIGWCDFSSNPLRYRDASGRDVWACVKVSPGCTNCYAAALAKRYGRGSEFNAAEMAKLTPYLDERELHRLATSKALSGKRVFLEDMSDLFGEWVPLAILNDLFRVLVQRRDVTWQLLTKRPKHLLQFALWWTGQAHGDPQLPAHIHVGTSVESESVAHRLGVLRSVPAGVRWVSFEPLLSPIAPDLAGISWAVIGGESGPGYRSVATEAIGDLAYRCVGAGVATFVKQAPGSRPGQQGAIPDHVWRLKQFPAVTA